MARTINEINVLGARFLSGKESVWRFKTDSLRVSVSSKAPMWRVKTFVGCVQFLELISTWHL